MSGSGSAVLRGFFENQIYLKNIFPKIVLSGKGNCKKMHKDFPNTPKF